MQRSNKKDINRPLFCHFCSKGKILRRFFALLKLISCLLLLTICHVCDTITMYLNIYLYIEDIYMGHIHLPIDVCIYLYIKDIVFSRLLINVRNFGFTEIIARKTLPKIFNIIFGHMCLSAKILLSYSLEMNYILVVDLFKNVFRKSAGDG